MIDAAPGSLETRLVPLADRVAWQAALDGIPHAPAHTWAYREAIARTPGDPVWLLVCVAPGGRFVCPVAERSFAGEPDAYTPYGFAGPVGIGDPVIFEAGISRVAAERGWVASYFGLHPALAPSSLVATPGAVVQGTAYLLDLTADEPTLRARMTAGNRQRLRAYPTLLGSIAERTETLIAFFVDTYPAFMEARGAAPVYAFTPDTLRALCTLEAGTVVGLPREAPTSAAVFAWTASGAEWSFSVRDAEGGASLLPVVWHIALRLRATGLPWLNLGGGIREGDGVATFKRQLGAEPVPIVALRQVHRPDAYARLCALAACPDDTAYFPAYRAGGSVTSGS